MSWCASIAPVDRVAAGVRAVVVVEGPAGIGKTELLAAVGAGAQARGLDVLRARGVGV